jgi:glycerol-1-phosphate dehydrogenase [NAD(P)+]
MDRLRLAVARCVRSSEPYSMPAAEPTRDPIAQLLAGTYPDPETGQLLHAEAKSVVIEDSLEGREVELVAALAPGKHIALITDAITHVVMGTRVQHALASRFHVQSIVLPGSPRADAETVARIAAALDRPSGQPIDAVVAVGSGTLNDLSKMVAFQRGVPQMVFATAPSMNGYTSLSASITTDGVKRSFRTRTPVGVFFDLRVLAAAPLRLIRAGLGDSACRPTSQADWLLSHLLLDRPYREAPYAILDEDEPALFAQTRGLVSGDLAVMRHLVRTLVLSGFGMTLSNGSYPASQGEHLLSHYIEMMRPADAAAAFHGEQVGVCTVAMAKIQDQLLALDRPPTLQPTRVTREHVLAHFGEVMAESIWRELEGKHFDARQTEALNARLASQWSSIRERIASITIGATVHRELLEAAGAPVEPAALGWSTTMFDHAIRHAREIRNRYTFLDLRADSQA